MNLAGSIYDELGAPINEATVSVKNEAGVTVASTTTGPTGAWSVNELTATDAHTVVVTLAGSQVRKIAGDIRVQVGEIVVIDKIELATGGALVLPNGAVTSAALVGVLVSKELNGTTLNGATLNGTLALNGTIQGGTLTSPAITAPTGIVKADVGLGSVDNTSDATKNAAVATLTSKTLTTPGIANYTNAQHNHSSAVQGGTGVGEIEIRETGTCNSGNVDTSHFVTSVPNSKVLGVWINGLLKTGWSRASSQNINFNEGRVVGDVVEVHYVAA